jgi:hypothetical protein
MFEAPSLLTGSTVRSSPWISICPTLPGRTRTAMRTGQVVSSGRRAAKLPVPPTPDRSMTSALRFQYCGKLAAEPSEFSRLSSWTASGAGLGFL